MLNFGLTANIILSFCGRHRQSAKIRHGAICEDRAAGQRGGHQLCRSRQAQIGLAVAHLVERFDAAAEHVGNPDPAARPGACVSHDRIL
jgi:hypothetical protein